MYVDMFPVFNGAVIIGIVKLNGSLVWMKNSSLNLTAMTAELHDKAVFFMKHLPLFEKKDILNPHIYLKNVTLNVALVVKITGAINKITKCDNSY